MDGAGGVRGALRSVILVVLCFSLLGVFWVPQAAAEANHSGNAGDLLGELGAAGLGGGGIGKGGRGGDFTHGYQFDVPAGRNGLSPSLGLTYTSGGAVHGGLAAGWSLSAGGVITFDTSGGTVRAEWPDGGTGQALRNFVGPDGRMLVHDDKLPVAEGAYGYRAVGDAGTTVYEFQAETAIPYWWVVSNANGLKSFYGEKDAHPFTWAPLVRVTEPDGQDDPSELRYTYEKVGRTTSSPSAGQPTEFLLTAIDYQAPGVDVSYARVVFGYEDPTYCGSSTSQLPVGAHVNYRHGFARLSGTRKLTSVRTLTKRIQGSGFDIRDEYELRYSDTDSCDGPVTPFRQLESVVRTVNRPGIDGQEGPTRTVLPPTTFTYGEAAPYTESHHYLPAEPIDHLQMPESIHTNQFFQNDPDDPSEWRFSPHAGGGCSARFCPISGTTNPLPEDPHWMLATAQSTGESVSRTWVDVNRDGLKDMLAMRGGPVKLAAAIPETGQCMVDVYLNTGSGFDKQEPGDEFPPFSLASTMGDIPVSSGNELLCSLSRSLSSDDSGGWLGQPNVPCASAWVAGANWGSMQQARHSFRDMDGDGFVDLVTQIVASVDCPYASTMDIPPPVPGTRSTPDPHWQFEHYDDTLNPVGDPNDAHPERVITKRQKYLWVYRNTGNGFDDSPVRVDTLVSPGGQNLFAAYYTARGFNQASHAMIDMSGDGFADLLYQGGSTSGGRVGVAIGTGPEMAFTDAIQLPDEPQNTDLGPRYARAEVTPDPDGPATPWLDLDHAYTGHLAEGVVVDVNGDGLPDRAEAEPNGTRINFNTGFGFASAADDGEVMFSDGEPDSRFLDSFRAPDLHNKNWQYYPATSERSGKSRMLDLDVDGLPDLLFYDREANRAMLYHGGGRQWVIGRGASAPVAQHLAGVIAGLGTGYDGTVQEFDDRADYRYVATHLAEDLNGDGLRDLVFDPEGDGVMVRYADPVIGSGDHAAPARLLRTIDNGTGGKTTVSYTRDVQAGRWVASQVTVNPGHGQPQITREHTYLKPVFDRGRYGRVGFRGYAEVHARAGQAPGHQDDRTDVTRWRYDRDPGGEVTLTATVAGAAVPYSGLVETQPGVMSFAEYSSSIRNLGLRPPGVIPGYPIGVVLPQATEFYTCAGRAGQTLSDCRTTGKMVLQETQWAPQYQNGTYVMELPERTRVVFTNGEGHTEERRAEQSFHLVWTAETFNVAPERTADTVVSGGTTTQLGEVRYTYADAAFRRIQTITVDDAKAGVPDRTSRFEYHDSGTARGRLHRIWAPEQVARYHDDGYDKGFTEYDYDAHGMHVARVRNPAGHLVRTVVDPATGAVLETIGPNYACPDGLDPGTELDVPSACSPDDAMTLGLAERTRVHVDGLARPVRIVTYPAGDPGQTDGVEVFRATYQDLNYQQDQSAIAIVVEQRGGNDTFDHVTTRMDGLGRTLRTEVVQDDDTTRVTSYAYDREGRLRDVTVPRGDGEPGTITLRAEYDPLHRELSRGEVTSTGVKLLETYSYDGLTTTATQVVDDWSAERRSTLTVDPIGQLISVAEKWHPFQADAVTRYTYDGQGNTATVTDAEGNVTTLTHDYSGNRLNVERAGKTWRYGYDANSNLTSLVEPLGTGDVEADYTHRSVYDDLNRLVRTEPAARDLDEEEIDEFAHGPTIYTYDTAHESLDPTSGYAGYTIGRLTAVNQYTVDDEPVSTTITRYDDRGDAVGLTQRLHFLAGLPGIPSNTLEMELSRDEAGIAEAVRFQAHDTTGQLVHLGPEVRTTDYDRDGAPSALSFTLGEDVMGIAHDRNSAGLLVARRTNTQNSPAFTAPQNRYTRDEYGRVIEMVTGFTDPSDAGDIQAPIVEQRYRQEFDYYDNNQIKSVTEQLGNAGAATSTTTYTYTNRHELWTAVQTGDGGVGYFAAFDFRASGRLDYANIAVEPEKVTPGTRVTTRGVAYRYEDSASGGDPLQLDALATDTTDLTDYTYDQAGNTTSRTLPDGSTALHRWGGPSLLRKTTTSTGSQVHYYDGGGKTATVSRAADGAVTSVHRYFAGLEVVHKPGQAAEYRQPVALGGEIVGRIDGDHETGTFEHYTTSPQGHHVLALGEDGGTRRVTSYGAFGEVLRNETAATTPSDKYTHEFNGKEYDADSGLHDYGFRSYDPLALQWISADPLYTQYPDLAAAMPARANLYTFTANDPVNLSDPNGLDVCSPSQPCDETWVANGDGTGYETSMIMTGKRPISGMIDPPVISGGPPMPPTAPGGGGDDGGGGDRAGGGGGGGPGGGSPGGGSTGGDASTDDGDWSIGSWVAGTAAGVAAAVYAINEAVWWPTVFDLVEPIQELLPGDGPPSGGAPPGGSGPSEPGSPSGSGPDGPSLAGEAVFRWDRGHASVAVLHYATGRLIQTHLTADLERGATAVSLWDYGFSEDAKFVSFRLPNAVAAQAYQVAALARGTAGQYRLGINDCLTHVSRVLLAGGLPISLAGAGPGGGYSGSALQAYSRAYGTTVDSPLPRGGVLTR